MPLPAAAELVAPGPLRAVAARLDESRILRVGHRGAVDPVFGERHAVSWLFVCCAIVAAHPEVTGRHVHQRLAQPFEQRQDTRADAAAGARQLAVQQAQHSPLVGEQRLQRRVIAATGEREQGRQRGESGAIGVGEGRSQRLVRSPAADLGERV
ncbi:MAG TPA: hypothetical protein PK752_23190, partial [Accumulibacter sp.]|uniref:hypothetical protein n=1 Tax=Accumulibacter sp. TaxID=2053492 RepID=UPI002B7D24D2